MQPRYLVPVAAALMITAVPVLATSQSGPQVPGAQDVSRVSAGTYRTDPLHTLVGWSVNHFGFNDYYGVFGDAEGVLQIDPANPAAASVAVTIPITSLAVVSEGLREHLLRGGKDGAAADFFGPEPAPAIFRSTSVRMDDDDKDEAVITGNLTLNGVTRPITIEAEFTGAGANPMSKKETIGFEGETVIRRSEFGMSALIPLVADEVELKISAAFEKQ
ncbi:YceI family protein [Croceicoccus sp. F390]|uniref:YceI family protein n=1 Tax=Croceicoccus esteveae TaxID=3075597 RepID=A0ABU2ZEQ0_9SPHN|nr:YceI family protein [Croceicoccus sp. F390]MDT0575077.1 YceI family protein [Croceicoccus sp. F390]